MRLTAREERMRAGELGEPALLAIEQQIAVGEFFEQRHILRRHVGAVSRRARVRK